MTDTIELEALRKQIVELKSQLHEKAIAALANAIRDAFPQALGFVLDTESDHGYRWYFLGGIYTDWDDATGEEKGDPIDIDETEKHDEEFRDLINYIDAPEPGWLSVRIPQETTTDELQTTYHSS